MNQHSEQQESLEASKNWWRGVRINGAMASAVNSLGDVHGGAGQQCMSLYARIVNHLDNDMTLEQAATHEVAAPLERRIPIPGFGHRFHPVDPRSVRLLELVDKAHSDNVVAGRYAQIGRAVEDALATAKGKRLPMNTDGATAVIYSELGFAPELGRGLFVLSRSVGILSHAWEQSPQGERIKGPMPRSVPYAYTGQPPRNFEGLPE